MVGFMINESTILSSYDHMIGQAINVAEHQINFSYFITKPKISLDSIWNLPRIRYPYSWQVDTISSSARFVSCDALNDFLQSIWEYVCSSFSFQPIFLLAFKTKINLPSLLLMTVMQLEDEASPSIVSLMTSQSKAMDWSWTYARSAHIWRGWSSLAAHHR